MSDKEVLVVDEIADTTGSLTQASGYVTEHEPAVVRTATLQLMTTGELEPDHVGVWLERWTWIVHRWNFIEDLVGPVRGGLERDDHGGPSTPDDVRALLSSHHEIDRIVMEIAHPNRLGGVLDERARRDPLEPVVGGRFVPAD